MTGTLPDEVSELVYLQSITLDWNGFYGTLPKSWAKNKHLLNIEVHYNFITGGIPEEWYGSQGLQRMNVGGNMLTGTVSTQVGQLSALKGYFVMENQMTGKIPTEFGSLRFCCKYRIVSSAPPPPPNPSNSNRTISNSFSLPIMLQHTLAGRETTSAELFRRPLAIWISYRSCGFIGTNLPARFQRNSQKCPIFLIFAFTSTL